MKPFPCCATVLLALAAAAVQPADAATFQSLDPKATYLRTNESSATPGALALKLSDLGFAPGDRLLLEVLGDIDNGPGGDTFTFTLGLFSSSSTLLPQTQLNRVPGALASDGVPFVTTSTFFGGLATDIAQDFGFDKLTPAVVTVPAGAVYLFLAKHDRLYEDNSDPDGDYGVRVGLAPVPEPGSAALLAAGLWTVFRLGQRQRR